MCRWWMGNGQSVECKGKCLDGLDPDITAGLLVNHMMEGVLTRGVIVSTGLDESSTPVLPQLDVRWVLSRHKITTQRRYKCNE